MQVLPGFDAISEFRRLNDDTRLATSQAGCFWNAFLVPT
jgi:hypothetical protein